MYKIFTCIALIVFLTAGNIASAQAIYVKATDPNGIAIPGEVIVTNYTGDIAASSFGQDNTACSLNGGGTTGTCKPTLGHFIFNMKLDKSVPILNQYLFATTPLKTVEFIFTRAVSSSTPLEYYTIHLQSVAIVHITNAIDPTSGAIVQVELAPVRAGWTYTPVNPNGSAGTPVKFGWDYSVNAPWNGF